MLYNKHGFVCGSMGILNGIVVRTAPWMPKFIIGRIASVYVAGDKLEDGLNLAKLVNSRGFSATQTYWAKRYITEPKQTR